MKKLTGILLFTLFSILTSMTAFAGEWRTGAIPNEGSWWYENDDGTYASNGWFWLDGNRDGVMEGEDGMIRITIQVGDRQFEAALIDQASTQTLIAQMPLTLNMSEMNGNEKYYYLPYDLPTDMQSIGTIRSGDLMLYGSDCLVLFYEDFRTSFQYTRLGSVSNPSGLAEALGRGNAQVTFRLQGKE